MNYQFQFRSYQRRFRQPLKTSRGLWEIRAGILLNLRAENGRIGWGEVAPLPAFGSETLQEALDFCQQLGGEISAGAIASIPDALPACQFAFESAASQLETPRTSEKKSLSYSWLLPTGETAFQAWKMPWQQGIRTFKWKIGVAALAAELTLCEQLVRALPVGAKLRLDANGGLTQQEAKTWLQACDRLGKIEFLEQPLPPDQFEAMLALDGDFATPVALDESVANLRQLEDCYQRGWRGLFVIKAAIAGSPRRLRQFCQQHPIDAVFSSVFETEMGRQAALNLAAELSSRDRAVGFGVQQWFAEVDSIGLQA